MNVQEWFKGAFVSNENWLAQPSVNLWAEDGQVGGWSEGGHDCCALRWFTAWYTTSGYGQNEPGYVVPPSPPNQYLVKTVEAARDCFEIDSNPVGCAPGAVLSASKEVQVGMEAAQETEPTNWAHDESAVEWTNSTWHHWNKVSFVAQNKGHEFTPHVCVGQNGFPYPGWAAFGTC
jgi:hypothetical protein